MKDARQTYLESRHKAIQDEIAEIENQQARDNLMIADLKRRKLYLEIELEGFKEFLKLKLFQ